MARPDVINRAAMAPVSGQGLGSTMWYACAWWAIRRFLVDIGLVVVQIRMLELLRRLLQVGLTGIEGWRLRWLRLASGAEERRLL